MTRSSIQKAARPRRPSPITHHPVAHLMPNGSTIVPKGTVVNDNFHMEASGWRHERFVEWLRGQLRRRGWNAAELARRLHVPSGTISRWMTGERQPSSHSCDLLADVLGVDLDLVLTLAGHRPGPETIAPDDQRAAIIALLERINLTPDRAAGLQGTLTSWLELDREERRGENGAGEASSRAPAGVSLS